TRCASVMLSTPPLTATATWSRVANIWASALSSSVTGPAPPCARRGQQPSGARAHERLHRQPRQRRRLRPCRFGVLDDPPASPGRDRFLRRRRSGAPTPL